MDVGGLGSRHPAARGLCGRRRSDPGSAGRLTGDYPTGHHGPVVTSLSPRVAAALRETAFTYPEVGATADSPPAGYRTFTRTRTLSDAEFDHAGALLMAWQAHERAGLRVAASSKRAEAGAVVLMRLGIGRVSIRIPCRVVYVIDEPDRIGFAYGTLPGHPVAGE